MTEQRLQEIEASIGRIECPECGGSGVYLDVPTGNEACDECDGSGMVSQFPPADELIAAVRTLTAAQDEAEATIAILRSAHVAALQDVQDVKAENATMREQLQAAQAAHTAAVSVATAAQDRLESVRAAMAYQEQAHPTPAQEGQ